MKIERALQGKANEVPYVAPFEFELINTYYGDGKTFCCGLHDGRYCAIVLTTNKISREKYSAVVCGEWKTMRGFENWRKRFYTCSGVTHKNINIA